jgi:serine/threonine-protein kinase
LIGAGQSIGNYRILAKIGTGGMGAVYLAEHPLIGKKVALKVIHRELAGNKEVVQRFFQEAKAVNKIGNEHIVEIHDFGITPQNDHFYIMEYLEGETLAGLLSKDRLLDVMRALHIGAQIANALAAAHAAGVIHRDLKPDNVMLTNRLGDPDFVKLLDFGLAKMFTAGGGSSAVKTAAGILLGTPQYMSPEACESRPNVDHRTDIYALGVLLFQMTTGALPFDGETMGEVLVKQVTQLPPPPRGYNAQIPPSVEQILLRCLMKSPDQRFPTMNALREALLDPERYLGNRPPIAPARSIRPGEAPADAKTVMHFAAEQQKTRMLDGAGGGVAAAGLPLPAPQKTMLDTGGAPPVPAKTMIASDFAPSPPPELAKPTAPKTNTMRIATPLGYTSRPPRKLWPIVLVLGLLLGLGGGAFAVAWFGRTPDDHGAAAAVDAHPTTPIAAGSDTPHTVTPPRPPPVAPPADARRPVAPGPALANVEIDSEPPGADVTVDKKLVGKTPAKLELPVSDLPVAFELHLPGYRKKTKQVIVSGNSVVDVPLEREPASGYTPTVGHGPHGGHKGSGSQQDTGLMNPEDM